MNVIAPVRTLLLILLAFASSRAEGTGEDVKCDPTVVVVEVTELSTEGPEQRLLEEAYDRVITGAKPPSIQILCGQLLCSDHPDDGEARQRMRDQKDAFLTPGFKTYGHAHKIRRKSSGETIVGISGTCGANVTGMVTVIADERIPTGHTPSYGELYEMVEVMCHEMSHTNNAQGFDSDLQSAKAEVANEHFIRTQVMPGLEKMLKEWAKELKEEARRTKSQPVSVAPVRTKGVGD